MDKSWIDSIELEKKDEDKQSDSTTQDTGIMCGIGNGVFVPQKDIVDQQWLNDQWEKEDKSKWETLKKFCYNLMHGNIYE